MKSGFQDMESTKAHRNPNSQIALPRGLEFGVAHTPLESPDRLGGLRPQREFGMIICKVGPVAFRKPCLNSRILGSLAKYSLVPRG